MGGFFIFFFSPSEAAIFLVSEFCFVERKKIFFLSLFIDNFGKNQKLSPPPFSFLLFLFIFLLSGFTFLFPFSSTLFFFIVVARDLGP